MKNSIKIMLVEDHELVRSGLSSLLGSRDGIEVIAEAGDGMEALQKLQGMTNGDRPQIVLMDITMPGMNGLDTAVEITRQFPDIRIMILSMHNNQEMVAQSLRAGASGYLLKDSAAAELEVGIRAVARGEKFLCPAVSSYIVNEYLGRGTTQKVNPIDRLTPRQQQVFRLIVNGETTNGIAKVLKISPKTVESHRLQLMDRLQIFDIAGLVRLGMRNGFVTGEEPPAENGINKN